MAVTLGKRKRRLNAVSGNRERGVGLDDNDEGPRAEDVFRRLFEARFRPLTARNPSEGEGEGLEEEGDGDVEEWAGFSDDEEEEEEEEEDGGVEVVECGGSFVGAVDHRVGRREVRAFMVSECAGWMACDADSLC